MEILLRLYSAFINRSNEIQKTDDLRAILMKNNNDLADSYIDGTQQDSFGFLLHLINFDESLRSYFEFEVNKSNYICKNSRNKIYVSIDQYSTKM